jgi:nucleoside-diphosphate-sugar epimerase
MMMERKVALVAGATGIIGRGIVEHLSSATDWEVVGLARGVPDYERRARFVPVDLLDPKDCRAKLGSPLAAGPREGRSIRCAPDGR